MRKFQFYWIDGSFTEAHGKNVQEAFMNLDVGNRLTGEFRFYVEVLR